MKNTLILLLFPFLMIGQTQIGEDIDGEAAFDFSGTSISLSSDGTIIAIGASGNDDNGNSSGHVRIFENIDGNWQQVGDNINGEAASDFSGRSISLSSEGTIVAIGAPGNDDNGADSGQVRIFENIAGSWQQIGDDINGETVGTLGDALGESVSLSSNGSIIAIGAPTNNVASDALGSVRIFENIAGSWQQIGEDINGEAASDFIGNNINLSSDGTIIAIGTSSNDGNGMFSGHVRVFENIDGIWQQIGEDIDGEAANDFSGDSLSLSSDGTILAIGARFNDGNGLDSGHVRIFKNIAGSWEQIGENIVGEAAGDRSGLDVNLSSDGSIIAIGAQYNDGNGIDSGHVRIFKNIAGNWTQIGDDINGETAGDKSGKVISLSSDGGTVAIGVLNNDGNGSNSGHVRLYDLFEFICNFSCINIEVALNENGLASITAADILSNESSSDLNYSINLNQFNCDNLGDNPVLITAINIHNNEATCEAIVTVVDNLPPSFECLDDIIVEIPENENYVIPNYIVTEGIVITDNCNVDNMFQSPIEGTLIPAGTTETITIIAEDTSGNIIECLFNITVEEILSIEENIFNPIILYPNPASKIITIRLSENQEINFVKIYNTLGKLLQTESKNSIDISALATGSYYVQVTTDEGVSTQKLLVE